MAGYIIVGTLAAFGAFSMLWALLGWLLPAGQGCVLVCFGQPDEGILSRFLWLRGAGLLTCPLLAVVPEGTDLPEPAQICTVAELPARLEWERNQFHGTGNGDHSGRHRRCDIPEL